MEQIAQKILASAQAMVPGRFTIEHATHDTHPHVDWTAYAAVREAAAELGFRHLGDVDVTSVHMDPSMMKRAVLAIYASEEGARVLGHYRVVLRWTPMGTLARLLGVLGDVFDLSTMFEGAHGVILETTTAQAAAVWDVPDFLLRETMKRGTSLAAVVERHRERLREYRDEHPDARPIVVRTLQETVAITDITEKRKLAWRRELGWVTRDEIARVSKLSGPELDKLYEAFRGVAAQS